MRSSIVKKGRFRVVSSEKGLGVWMEEAIEGKVKAEEKRRWEMR